mmetsp:Transcript_2008/g.5275  ORF Transcript_2008/g.5275 Transcript_2008/m.5275 type:complete len:315 (-) Transcript_2008:556-1500(-)
MPAAGMDAPQLPQRLELVQNTCGCKQELADCLSPSTQQHTHTNPVVLWLAYAHVSCSQQADCGVVRGMPACRRRAYALEPPASLPTSAPTPTCKTSSPRALEVLAWPLPVQAHPRALRARSLHAYARHPRNPSASEPPPATGCTPAYSPLLAAEFAAATAASSACASRARAGSLAHSSSTECCSARPYENDSDHGQDVPGVHAAALMAFRFTVASSSLCPPLRNMTPGMAAGTVRRSAATVCAAISEGVALVLLSTPGRTICGLSRQPSSSTEWCHRREVHALSTRSATSCDRWMVWLPSMRISGSTIGTRPAV